MKVTGQGMLLTSKSGSRTLAMSRTKTEDFVYEKRQDINKRQCDFIASPPLTASSVSNRSDSLTLLSPMQGHRIAPLVVLSPEARYICRYALISRLHSHTRSSSA